MFRPYVCSVKDSHYGSFNTVLKPIIPGKPYIERYEGAISGLNIPSRLGQWEVVGTKMGYLRSFELDRSLGYSQREKMP